MSAIAAELRQRLEGRTASVGVIGLGYVGLPLAVAFAEAGFSVIGVDADPGRVELLSSGSSPVQDVSDQRVAALVRSKRLVINEQCKPVKNSRILVLGVAYKAGVSDVRESPALEIIEALARRGARVEYTDPRVPDWAQADLALYDLVVVLTAHPEFDARRVVREARLVLDTRNLTGELGPHPHVVRL
jgi:UDP-N-acetyl-D-mannosaminuronate dehydrogenase